MTNNTTMAVPLVQTALEWAEVVYPVLMCLGFIAAAAGCSVYESRSEEEINGTAIKGPDGHILPVARKHGNHMADEALSMSPAARSVFRYINAAVVLTFIANGVAVVTHAMKDHLAGDEQRWWCEQSRLVWFAKSCQAYDC
jgi:hypothetical protein